MTNRLNLPVSFKVSVAVPHLTLLSAEVEVSLTQLLPSWSQEQGTQEEMFKEVSLMDGFVLQDF